MLIYVGFEFLVYTVVVMKVNHETFNIIKLIKPRGGGGEERGVTTGFQGRVL